MFDDSCKDVRCRCRERVQLGKEMAQEKAPPDSRLVPYHSAMQFLSPESLGVLVCSSKFVWNHFSFLVQDFALKPSSILSGAHCPGPLRGACAIFRASGLRGHLPFGGRRIFTHFSHGFCRATVDSSSWILSANHVSPQSAQTPAWDRRILMGFSIAQALDIRDKAKAEFQAVGSLPSQGLRVAANKAH